MILLLPVAQPTSAFAAGADIFRLSYNDVSGAKYILDPTKNKLTALHFWATWCGPCMEELPEVNYAQKKYAGKGFQVIPISLDGRDFAIVEEFYDRKNIDALPMYFDFDMSAFKMMKIKSLPTTFFIDDKGRIISTIEGVLDWKRSDTQRFIESRIRP